MTSFVVILILATQAVDVLSLAASIGPMGTRRTGRQPPRRALLLTSPDDDAVLRGRLEGAVSAAGLVPELVVAGELIIDQTESQVAAVFESPEVGPSETVRILCEKRGAALYRYIVSVGMFKRIVDGVGCPKWINLEEDSEALFERNGW